MEEEKVLTVNAAEIFEEDPLSISELYHENTKLRKCNVMETGLKITSIQYNPALLHSMSRAFKVYRTAPQICLDKDITSPSNLLEEVIIKRRSIREYVKYSITLQEISKILHYSYGITDRIIFEIAGVKLKQPLRAAPSGGALYPIEIYVATLQSEIEEGLYHYNPRDHVLEQLKKGNKVSESLANGTSYPEIVRSCGVVFILTGVFNRIKFKYGERGYRYVLLEAGHIAQNIYLIATSLNLGAVGLAGFYDSEIDQLLNIDGVNESTLYLVAVGKPKNGGEKKRWSTSD